MGSRGLAAGDRRPAIPFPGGLISGVLVAMAIAPEGRHGLIWVALVPFLVSLERNRGRTGARILHALCFGATLASYLRWSGVEAPGLFLPPDFGPEVVAFQVLVGSFIAAALLVILAAAAGPVLRAGSWALPLGALPVLWSGLDWVRHGLAPLTASLLSPSLTVAHAIPPSTPIAQAAATAGIHGLVLLVVLANTLFFLALRGRGLGRRIAAAAAALAVPGGLHLAGAAGLPPEPSPGHFPVAAAAAPSLDEAIRLLEPVELNGSGLLLLPPAVGAFAIQEAQPLVSGLAARKGAFVLFAVPRSDGSAAIWRMEPDGTPVERPPSGLISIAHAVAGVGARGDFDRPSRARRLALDGAAIFILLDDRAGGGTRGEALRSTVQAYRTVENRRWLVKAGPGGASIVDPYGRVVARVAPGIAGAVLDGVDFLDARTFYMRAGPWIEGLLGAGAAAVLLASFIARSRGGPRGGPPAGPSP